MDKNSFKFNIEINQYTAFTLFGNAIDFNDLAIFDFIRCFACSPKCIKMVCEGKSYFMMTRSLIMQHLPLLGITSKRAISNRLDKLCELDIIQRYQGNRSENVSYYTFGSKYDELMFTPVNENSQVGVKNKHHVGTEFHSPVNQTSHVPMNQTSHNYKDNGYNKDNLKENDSSSSALDSAKVWGGGFDENYLKNFEGANEGTQVESALDAQNTPNPQVAPTPLSPTSIEALEVSAVAYGCGDKSKAYAGEFFWKNEANNWQVNSSGSKMKDIKKHFKKFLEGKIPKKETPVHPAYQKCVELFLTRYQELYNRPHTVMEGGKARQGIDAKGGKALKEILPMLEAEMRHKRKQDLEAQGTSIVLEEITFTQEEVEKGFWFVMQGYTHDNPRMQWYISNMSLPILNSKFNEVINIIQETNGTTRNTYNNKRNEQPSTAELARMAMQAKYGEGFDRMQQC